MANNDETRDNLGNMGPIDDIGYTGDTESDTNIGDTQNDMGYKGGESGRNGSTDENIGRTPTPNMIDDDDLGVGFDDDEL